MNRKTLIICLSALGVMLVGIIALLTVLYWNPDKYKTAKAADAVGTDREILTAVPSNAVIVAMFGNLKDANGAVLLHDGFIDALADAYSQGRLRSLRNSAVAVSYHYSASLVPLYIIDAGKSSSLPEDEVSYVEDLADSLEMCCFRIDCSKIMNVAKSLRGNTLLVISSQNNLPAAAERHLENSISILDADGFVQALNKLSGDDLLLFSNVNSDKILPAVGKDFRRYSRFMTAFSSWTAFAFDAAGNNLSLQGSAVYDESTDFASVMASSTFRSSSLAEVLPSYTFFALSLPFRSASQYRENYERWLDAFHRIQTVTAERKKLTEANGGLSPIDWEASLDIQEVACASFVSGKTLMNVNLVKLGKGVKEARSYPGYVASLYGSLFSLDDESCSALVNGWLVSGSRAAVDEFTSGKAADYTLSQRLADAGVNDCFASGHSCTAYLNFKENTAGQQGVFSPTVLSGIEKLEDGCALCPVFMSLKGVKGDVSISVQCSPVSQIRSKVPSFERDTEVIVPKGPFSVKNCSTGKINSFFQNDGGYLCLDDENGKGLWAVPFSGALCGAAETIDYFNNGKLQILFASGSKLYLIDRLGRFVNPFPVELGKEVLLGPAVYDLSGAKRYNVLVLHKDNTLDMYNLKGSKPASWKGIAPDSTIKSLPERIDVSGKTFWIVRTSVETLVYPLTGGEPVFRNEGDDRIRPDSSVEVLSDGRLKLISYNGKEFFARLN